jgi:hypothetical protein
MKGFARGPILARTRSCELVCYHTRVTLREVRVSPNSISGVSSCPSLAGHSSMIDLLVIQEEDWASLRGCRLGQPAMFSALRTRN